MFYGERSTAFLYTSNLPTAISRSEHCLSSLHAWFCHNDMCLNLAKSEATLLSTSQCLRTFPAVHSLSVASSILTLADEVTTLGLGVILNSKLTFDAHVSAVCKKVHFHLRALRHIRPSLTDYMATSIPVTLTHSRLDYANSLPYGISSTNIHKLQRCQNTAARLILQQSGTSVEYLMDRLHWHPNRQSKLRLSYKSLSSVTS